MTVTNEQPLGLPSRNRNQDSLPNSSGNTPESLPAKRPAISGGGLPGSSAHRPDGLPSKQDSHPVRTALPVPVGLPERKLPQVGLPSKAESLPAKTEASMPQVPRRTVEDALPKSAPSVDALPSPVFSNVETFPVGLPPRKVALPVVEAVRVEAPKDDEALEVAPLVEKKTKRVAGPKPRAKVAKRKCSDLPPWNYTARDRWILETIFRYNLVTTNHIAYLLEISPASARKRLTVLMTQGLIRYNGRSGPSVWQITNDGIALIGKKNKAKVGPKFPSLLTFRHTLAIATVGITLEKGGPDAAKLVGNLLSEAPRVIVTEREMQSTEALRGGRDFLFANFNRLVDDLLHDEKFPVYPYSSVMSNERFESWSDEDFENMFAQELADKEILDSRFRGTDKSDNNHLGYSHLVTSHNPSLETNRTFGGKNVQGRSTRRPDALIVLPHEITADGVVTGGSIAVEVELNNKATLAEYKNIILHQYSHRVYAQAFWFFDDKDAESMFKQAMKELAESHNPPFTLEEAKKFFRRLKFHMLNAELDADGLYG
jgi:hypothetical protein